MSIYVGNTKIGQMYLGSTEIAEAYLGSTKVYQNGLPSGYTQLEYISNAARGILTNIATIGSVWEIELQMDSAPSSTQFVICSDDYAGHWFGARANGYYSLGDGYDIVPLNTRGVFSLTFATRSVTVSCNGISQTRTNSSRDQKSKVSIFNDMTTPNYLYKGKCYGIRCTSGGSFNGVPAQRDSDNHQGLYDMANGVFYDLS